MAKICKYKLYHLFSDKKLLVFSILLFLLFNYTVVISSGVIDMSGTFNKEPMYALIMNNFVNMSLLTVLLLSIYAASDLLEKRDDRNQLYLFLSIRSNREKLFLGSFLGTLAFLFYIEVLLTLNTLVLLLLFPCQVNVSDLLYCNGMVFLNACVLISFMAFFSLFLQRFGNALLGIAGYCFFNLYMYNELPFVQDRLSFDMSQYKNILCNFLPIGHIVVPSLLGTGEFADPTAQKAFELIPLLPNLYWYQGLYCVLLLAVACIIFRKKDL